MIPPVMATKTTMFVWHCHITKRPMSIMTGKYRTDGNHFSMGCATGNHSRLVLGRLMPSESLPRLVLFPEVVGPLKSPPLSGVKTHP